MAKFCTNCGSILGENAAFCTNCGKPISGSAPAEVKAPAVKPADTPVRSYDPEIKSASPKPIIESRTNTNSNNDRLGTFGYLGLLLLFFIPFFGFIANIICCFAGKNKSIHSFARAVILWEIIGIVIFFLIVSAVKSVLVDIFEDIMEQFNTPDGRDELSQMFGDTFSNIEGFYGSEDLSEILDGIQNGNFAAA